MESDSIVETPQLIGKRLAWKMFGLSLKTKEVSVNEDLQNFSVGD